MSCDACGEDVCEMVDWASLPSMRVVCVGLLGLATHTHTHTHTHIHIQGGLERFVGLV